MADREQQFEDFAAVCNLTNEDFLGLVREKRKIGEETYGDDSYGGDCERLKKEVIEECVDVMGWSSILYEVAKVAKQKDMQELAVTLSRRAQLMYEKVDNGKEIKFDDWNGVLQGL